MSRKFQDTKAYTVIRHKRQKDGSHKTVLQNVVRTDIRKGLKLIHIGNDVWRIGRHKITGENKHQVIYGPDDKEYHLYGTDVDFVNTAGNFERRTEPNHTIWRINRSGNIVLEARVKIYILTHILDQKENWCFDLSLIPSAGKLKVIYSNGTVKNIDFNGEFKDTFIRYRWADILSAEAKDLGTMIPAFGYRIPK